MLAAGVLQEAPGARSQHAGFVETFDGTPAAPTPWRSSRFDITYHARDAWYLEVPREFAGQHGGECSAPPDSHSITTWEGTVFQCNGHVMTTSPGFGYGLIYLTPDRLVDFSGGEAVVSWDMSTHDGNQRDWPSVTITPWEDNQSLALVSGMAQGTDLQGRPRNTVEVGFDTNSEGASIPNLYIVRDGEVVPEELGDGNLAEGIAAGTNQAATRQPFRLTVSRTHVRFERLASATGSHVVYFDRQVPDLGFDRGVVQFGHHAYDPEKDSPIQTWHWDNLSIEPAIPFTMIHADRRYVSTREEAGALLTFDAPAPANAYLRFAAVGQPYVSVGGGEFVPAQRQWEETDDPGHASSYWHPIPEGTREVRMRMGPRDWYDNELVAHDFTIWSLAQPGSSGSLPPAVPTAALPAEREPGPAPATETPLDSAPPSDGDWPNRWWFVFPGIAVSAVVAGAAGFLVGRARRR
jgi:hypothetical protein